MNHDDERVNIIFDTVLFIFAIVLIIFISLITLSCSSDDNKSQNDCKCDARLKDEGGTGFYVIKDVPLNCETNQPLELPNGTIFLGCDERNIP